MDSTQIQIGCDGGCITINSKYINGIFMYELITFEDHEEAGENKRTFINLSDAWSCLKRSYQKWYQLYPIEINKEMIDIMKRDYLAAEDKNEYTQEEWMQLLKSDGLAF